MKAHMTEMFISQLNFETVSKLLIQTKLYFETHTHTHTHTYTHTHTR